MIMAMSYTNPPHPTARPSVAALMLTSLLAMVALGSAGCAGPKGPLVQKAKVSPGQNEAAVLAAMGQPTNRYSMPQGSQRLEFAKGPLGYETWMVDLDANGRVTAAEQVLTQAGFDRVHVGMPAEALQRLLGRPAEKQRQYLDRVTWYWRYTPYDCLWWGVTVSPQGYAIDTGGNVPDPRCDATR